MQAKNLPCRTGAEFLYRAGDNSDTFVALTRTEQVISLY